MRDAIIEGYYKGLVVGDKIFWILTSIVGLGATVRVFRTKVLK